MNQMSELKAVERNLEFFFIFHNKVIKVISELIYLLSLQNLIKRAENQKKVLIMDV